MSNTLISAQQQANGSTTATFVPAPIIQGAEGDILTMKDFMIANKFTQVGAVKLTPKNSYPYLRFYTADNKVAPVMFSVNGGKLVAEGQVMTEADLKQFTLRYTANAAGELQWKLASGESQRLTVDFSLL